MIITLAYYSLNLFLKYVAGNLFTNNYTTAAGEIAGKLSAGLVISAIGLKRLYLVAFGLGMLGALVMIVFSEYGSVIPYCLFVSKFGYSMAFLGVYFNIILLFPTILKSSSMGFCNIFGRIAGIFAPFIAEATPPINLWTLFGCTVLAFVFS